MHAEMHAPQGMGMGPDMERMHTQMDEMRAQMWARLSSGDRARRQRMDEACAGLMTERTER